MEAWGSGHREASDAEALGSGHRKAPDVEDHLCHRVRVKVWA